MGSDVPTIRGTSNKASPSVVWSLLRQWIYFPSDVLIETCALSAMNMGPQTLDETI